MSALRDGLVRGRLVCARYLKQPPDFLGLAKGVYGAAFADLLSPYVQINKNTQVPARVSIKDATPLSTCARVRHVTIPSPCPRAFGGGRRR